MPSLPAIMKTTAARLTALYLVLFAACAVALAEHGAEVTLAAHAPPVKVSVA